MPNKTKKREQDSSQLRNNAPSEKNTKNLPRSQPSGKDKTKWVIFGVLGILLFTLIATGAFSAYKYISQIFTEDMQQPNNTQSNNGKQSSTNPNNQQNNSNSQIGAYKLSQDGSKSQSGRGSNESPNQEQNRQNSNNPSQKPQNGQEQEANNNPSPEKRIEQAVNSLEVGEGMEVRTIVLRKIKRAVDEVEADLRQAALKSVADIIDETSKQEISESEIINATEDTMSEVAVVLSEVRRALAQVAEVPVGQARAKEQKWKQAQELRESTQGR